jgi:hypothetical protein
MGAGPLDPRSSAGRGSRIRGSKQIEKLRAHMLAGAQEGSERGFGYTTTAKRLPSGQVELTIATDRERPESALTSLAAQFFSGDFKARHGSKREQSFVGPL